MNLDHDLRVDQPARDWTQPMAAWSRVTPDAAERRLQRSLQAERAVPVGPVQLKASSTHSLVGHGAVYLAEVRALPLRIPNPMPLLRLFTWSRRRA